METSRRSKHETTLSRPEGPGFLRRLVDDGLVCSGRLRRTQHPSLELHVCLAETVLLCRADLGLLLMPRLADAKAPLCSGVSCRRPIFLSSRSSWSLGSSSSAPTPRLSRVLGVSADQVGYFAACCARLGAQVHTAQSRKLEVGRGLRSPQCARLGLFPGTSLCTKGFSTTARTLVGHGTSAPPWGLVVGQQCGRRSPSLASTSVNQAPLERASRGLLYGGPPRLLRPRTSPSPPPRLRPHPKCSAGRPYRRSLRRDRQPASPSRRCF